MRWMVLVLALVSGCSFVMVRPTPQRLSRFDLEPGERGGVYCWQTGIPTADLLGLPLAGFLGLMSFGDALTCEGEGDCGRSEGIAAAAVGIVSLASAIYGYAATSVCMRRLEAHEQSHRQASTSPARLPK